MVQMMRLAMQDKRIAEAIQACPEAVDISEWEPFSTDLEKFVEIFLSSSGNRQLVETRGLEKSDLMHFYLAGVRAGMPNPFINHGGPMVAPTLFFLQEESVTPILIALEEEIRECSPEGRADRARFVGQNLTHSLLVLK